MKNLCTLRPSLFHFISGELVHSVICFRFLWTLVWSFKIPATASSLRSSAKRISMPLVYLLQLVTDMLHGVLDPASQCPGTRVSPSITDKSEEMSSVNRASALWVRHHVNILTFNSSHQFSDGGILLLFLILQGRKIETCRIRTQFCLAPNPCFLARL